MNGYADIYFESITKINGALLFMFLATTGLLCCTSIGHAQDSEDAPPRPPTKYEANAKRIAKREGQKVTEELIESLIKLFRVDLSTDTEPYDWIDVNIYDTTFTNIPHFFDSKQGKSITLQWNSSRCAEELNLWDVYGVEMQLEIPVIPRVGRRLYQDTTIGGRDGDYDIAGVTG